MATADGRMDDVIVISTPEGVDIELVLAGLGSRFLAATVDMVLTFLIILAFFLLAGLGFAPFIGDVFTPAEASAWAVAIVLIGVFLVQFFYAVLFEVWGGGKTPGKRWTGLRVVEATGGPVGFRASMVRNLVRIVDALPAGYAVGMIAILLSGKNQRVGDIFAGTLVIRDAHAKTAPSPTVPSPARSLPHWDTSAITLDELATVRAFLDRRTTLTRQARWNLAWELAERLRPKIPGAPAEHPEAFLERLVALKSARS